MPAEESLGDNARSVELPVLGLDATTLTFGDWLITLEPIVSEIGQGASQWWQLTLKSVEQAYEAWGWLQTHSNGYVLVQLAQKRRTNGLALKGGCLACCCKRCRTQFDRRSSRFER